MDAPIKRVYTKPVGYFFKPWFSFLFGGHLQISRSCNNANNEGRGGFWSIPGIESANSSFLQLCTTIMPTFSFCGLKKQVRSVLLEKLYLYIEEEFDLELVKYTYLSMEIYFWLNERRVSGKKETLFKKRDKTRKEKDCKIDRLTIVEKRESRDSLILKNVNDILIKVLCSKKTHLLDWN